MRSCRHESLLRRSQTQDSRCPQEAPHAQERGRRPLRSEPILGETLRQDGARWGFAGCEVASGQTSEEQRHDKEAAFGGPRRAAGGECLGKATLPGAYDGRVHERLDGEAAGKEAFKKTRPAKLS